MARRRLLPDAAYDFYARDGRADPDGPVRDTIEEARADVRAMRAAIRPGSRPAISVEWTINECKVLKLLRAQRK